MGRNPCCSKEGLNRGAWTAMEDKILREYIKVHGEGKWRNLPKRAGLKRCGKSCRLRWLNYLRPDIKRGNISHDEEELIIRLHNLLGNRWSLIAGRLPGRTDNEIKNYWNTNIGKKIQSGQPASTSNTTCRTKPPSNQPKLPPPSPNKTTLSNAQQPSETSPNPRVVRTKASRCTKVILPPHHDPQNNDHENGYKPALDTEVNDELVNDQIVVAGAVGPGDHDQPLIPFVPDDDDHHESNNSQYFMQADPDHHDFGMDEKFLSDFLNIDCLEMEFSDCFGMNGGRNDHESGIDFNIMTSPCSVDNVDPKGGSDDQNVLFSDQDMIEFLQSGSTSHDHLIDSNEMDWFQD